MLTLCLSVHVDNSGVTSKKAVKQEIELRSAISVDLKQAGT